MQCKELYSQRGDVKWMRNLVICWIWQGIKSIELRQWKSSIWDSFIWLFQKVTHSELSWTYYRQWGTRQLKKIDKFFYERFLSSKIKNQLQQKSRCWSLLRNQKTLFKSFIRRKLFDREYFLKFIIDQS